MNPLRKALELWARDRGYRIALGRPEVLDLARAEIEERRRAGEFDVTFYRDVLAPYFAHPDGAQLPRVASVILVSVPRPAHRVKFFLGPTPFATTVPPTYAGGGQLRQTIKDDLLAGPLHGGYGLELPQVPLKNVAARLGLVTYGRNNITFSPGSGSFHQLVACATDADLFVGDPGAAAESAAGPRFSGPELLCPECEGCNLCAQACPAGAIGDDRFLLHAERCLTYFSEYNVPWPKWLPASAHHCLIGCLRCQEACPQNRGLLGYEDLWPAFTAEETGRLLEGEPGTDPLWLAVKAKFEKLGLEGLEEQAPRTLAALLTSR